MERHYGLTDPEFERQFADGSLDPILFSHEAHLRLAWIHIKQYGPEKAIDNICRQINAFATSHGDKDKFNVTVTVAAVKAVYHFYLKAKSVDFQGFIQEFPRLKHKFRELIDTHYSTNIFTSEQAKREYLEPDREPFDDLDFTK